MDDEPKNRLTLFLIGVVTTDRMLATKDADA